MSNKQSRSEQREQILQLLYEKSYHEESVEEILSLANDAREYVPTAFVESEVNGVVSHLAEIDAEIEKHCKRWKLSRIPRVCLSIMRIAVYEMFFVDDIDNAVAINEAVELSKKYAGEDDKSYINGILGSVERTIKQ